METLLMKIVADPKLAEHLADNPFFADLDPTERGQIAPYLQSAEFTKGETIFQEGDDGSFACFIAEGQVDVCKQNEMGEQVLIAILAKGRSIGEMSLIDSAPRSASVTARSDGKTLLLHADSFSKLVDTHPRIGVRLLLRIARMMSMNLRKTSAKMAELLS